MTPPTVQGIPSTAAAGDTWRWALGALAQDYPASAGYTLTLTLRGATVPDPIAVDRTSGDVVTVPALTTADIAAGDYTVTLFAALGPDRYTIGAGVVRVTPDPASSTPTVSHARKCLALIEAALEGRVVSDAESYSILGRSITKTPIAELHRLRAKYGAEVVRERNRGALPTVQFAFTGGYGGGVRRG